MYADTSMNNVTCGRCGTLNPVVARFCDECAASLVQPAAVLDTPETTAGDLATPRSRVLPTPLAAAWAFLWEEQTGWRSFARTTVLTLLVFAFVSVVYFSSTRLHTYDGPSVRWQEPNRCCQFYAYLADAFNHETFDLAKVGIGPGTHADLVTVDETKVYLPYQPMPGVLLMPLVAIWGPVKTEFNFSIFLGAANVALFFHVLRLLGASRQTKFLLIPFFAFGTQHFHSATTGSIWFYNHTTAAFFLLLAIIFLLRRDSPILTGLALSAAALSRQPTVLAVPAFVFLMIEQRRPGAFSELPGALSSLARARLSRFWQGTKQLLVSLAKTAIDRRVVVAISLFLIALVPFVGVSLWYNDARFGGVFDTGLDEVYGHYQGASYTAYLSLWPSAERFAEFDLRNVPLHLYTIFLLPPTFEASGSLFQPSEYGMSVLLTSSPLAFAVFARRKDSVKVACWIALLLVPIPTLLYYSQGWVQFGYRYIMDYLPFLMVLTVFGFEDNRSPTAFRVKVALILISIVFGFWGRWWATHHGW